MTSPWVRRSAVAAAVALVIPLAALVGAPSASAATACTYGMNASWPPQVVTTISYEGHDQCAFKTTQTGQARLLDSKGTVVSAAHAYGCYCTYAVSRGTYSRAFLGQKFTLEYRLAVILPSTYRWGSLPPTCTGSGTRTMSCLDRQTFRVTLTTGRVAASSGVTFSKARVVHQ
jgi:hypothetical protein